MVGVNLAISESALKSILKGKPDLVGDHSVGVIRLLDNGMKKLTDIDQRKQPGDEENQGRDSQHEFCLQAHGLIRQLIPCSGVLLELVMQRLETDPEDLRGAGLVLSGGLKRAQNQKAFGLVHG